MNEINGERELEQYGKVFVLQEGLDMPITFRSTDGHKTLPSGVITRTLITAFHVKEGHDSEAFKQLTEYLQTAPVPITILAALPTSSTLLLLRVPEFIQIFLDIPRIVIALGT